MKMIKSVALAAGILFGSQIQAATFDWEWLGIGGGTASGSFSFDDSLDDTGLISAASGQIDSFNITGFIGGIEQFSWDLADGTSGSPFQMSFDTTADEIIFGGYYPTATDSIVFGDDSVAALICGTGNCGFWGSGITSTGWRSVGDKTQFVVTETFRQSEPDTQLSPVPVPAAAWLFGSALLGFVGFSRRTKVA